MCFSIPVKILKVNEKTAVLENGKTIKLEKDLNIIEGSYIRMAGDAIVDCLTQEEGNSIRQLIAELNTPYEQP